MERSLQAQETSVIIAAMMCSCLWRTLFRYTLVRVHACEEHYFAAHLYVWTINELHFSVKSRRSKHCTTWQLHKWTTQSTSEEHGCSTNTTKNTGSSYFTFSPVRVDRRTSHPPSVQRGNSGIKQQGTHEATNKNKTKLYHSCATIQQTGSQAPPSLVWEWGWVYCAKKLASVPGHSTAAKCGNELPRDHALMI